MTNEDSTINSENNIEQDWQAFTNEIVELLLEDGSNPEAMYVIEHHFVGLNSTEVDEAQQQAFLNGWDVSELEQGEDEEQEGLLLFCFDVETESPLDEIIIYEEVQKMVQFAEDNKLEYDGWGTHFED